MEIKNSFIAHEQPLVRQQIDVIRHLQIGQQFQAKVLSQLPGKTLLKLDLDGSIVNAKTLIKSVPGQILHLEVVKLAPLPQLKLIGTPQTEDIVVRTIRKLLPKQESSNSLQNQLLNLTQSSSKLSTLPPSYRPIAVALANGFPQLKDIIRPEGLKKAFNDSGLFLENKLANEENFTKSHILFDTKANLLRLLGLLKNTTSQQLSPPQTQAIMSQGKPFIEPNNPSQIRQTPPPLLVPEGVNFKNLLNQSEAVLAKVVLNQLASVPNDESGKQIWQLDLPFLNGQNAEITKLRIIRDNGSRENKNNERKWTVVLQLNPPGLGAITCKVCLTGEKVDAFFWSGDDKSIHLIKNKLSLLKDRFQKAKLHPGHLGARCGHSPSESTVHIREPLVDENV